jgi:predicted short-subunit dehydrogenase-like oxidoreductase (DUF2520 family)
MNIGLIGCGKVGTTMFYLLNRTNKIIGCYDIDKTNEKRTKRVLNITSRYTLEQLCTKSNALFFATPDDRILDAYNAAKKFIRHKTLVGHFSGLLTSTVFPFSKYTCRASIHPFATFPYISVPPLRKKYPLFTEGDAQALRKVRAIFTEKHFTIHSIRKKNKVLYHLIAVFASNFLIGLMSAAQSTSKRIGWEEKDFNDLVIPIMKETIMNARALGISKALTGPLARGDISTIKKHLKTLNKNKNVLNIYKTLSIQLIVSMDNPDNSRKIKYLFKT